ncbi:TatD family hydrolase [Desulfotomaculum sp. 1211_IL3151]|uniref:TatD family hydrolase n=1 Tax=Desulfotomaculum sp. 1211_IL3151 TaxID=3084055 RepID=UPI002FDA0C28
MSYLVDSHLHVTMMSYQGLQAMAEGGIKKAITCAIVLGAQHAESYFDHFRQITGFYKKNADGLGIKLYSTIGVHPAGIPHDWPRVIDALPDFLKIEGVVGLGEVGMNQGSQLERDVLKAQFEVARDHKLPIIVHTPFENRLPITELTLNIAAQANIPPHLLIIDHVNLDILDMVNQFGAMPAITIRSRNVTTEALYENMEQFQHGMLNCDFSNLFPNDPTAVIKAYQYLKSRGVSETIIENITCKKAEKIFNI